MLGMTPLQARFPVEQTQVIPRPHLDLRFVPGCTVNQGLDVVTRTILTCCDNMECLTDSHKM